MPNAGRYEYTIAYKVDESGLKQAITALQNIQKLTADTPGFSNMTAQLAEAKKSAYDLEQALTKAFNPKMGTVNTTALRDELSKLNLNQIRQDLLVIGPTGEKAFNQLAASAMKANLQINQSNTLLTRFSKTLFRNLEWLLSGNIISTITGVFTKAYGYTKNLDSSLNDIRIVTGKSADEMARLGEEAQKTAMALGKGTTDITNASLIYYQQGLDEEEVNRRTEVTAKMANVTGQASKTVADQMTAVWNGFQAGNDELERYADIMTKVAATTASSSAELSGAISKTAAIAKVTGVDMEQLTSMISTVISVTRDSPETVGTAFKTIFARINDLVEDGTDEFGVSLGRVSSHLAAMGIQILDQDGKLRDLGETISSVGEKWTQYSREQQVAIAEQMGGKRQWGQILTLFDNWDKYKDTLVAATNATGSLNEQQEIYMDRVEAHLQQIKTAWEAVYKQVLNEDDIVQVADAITSILNKLTIFLDAVGGFKPVLDMVITMMMQAFGPKMAQEIDRTISNIKGSFSNLSAEAAQRDITLMFGNLGDKGLLSELVEHQKTINRYKDQMNEKDKEAYSNYLNQKIELNAQTKELKEQVEVAKDFAQARKEIGEAYTKAGGFDVGGFAIGEVETRLAAVRGLLQGQVVDPQGDAFGEFLGGADSKFSLLGDAETFATETQNRVTQIENLINVLKTYKQEVQQDSNNEVEIARINKLTNALEKVRDSFSNATNQTEAFEKELDKNTTAAEKAATQLLNLKTATPSAGRETIADYFSAGRDDSSLTQFREDNNKVLAESRANIDTYKNLVEDLGKVSIFSSEQVAKLNAELNAQKPNLDSLKESLKQELGVSEKGLENIMKVIEQHSESQLKIANETNKVLDNAQRNMEKSLSFREGLTNLTRMASLVSQMAMSFRQIGNIVKTIQDNSIKTSEKIGRVVSSVVMMLPMLTTTITRIGSFFLSPERKAANEAYETELAAATKARQDAEAANQKKNDAEEALRQKQNLLAQSKAELTEEEKRHARKLKNIEEEKAAVMAVPEATEQKYTAKQALYQGRGYGTGDQQELQRLENQWAKQQAIAEERVEALKAETIAENELNASRTEGIQTAVAQSEAEISTAKSGVVSAAAADANAGAALKEAESHKAAALAAKEHQAALLSLKIYAAVAILVIAAAVAAYKKIKEAQEEAAEATERQNEAYNKFVDSQKELRKTIQDNLKEFGKFKEVWNSFKEGKTVVDDLTASMDALAEKFAVIDDPEYLRLKRIAEYTGQYEAIYNYLQGIADSQNEVEKRATQWRIDLAKEKIAEVTPTDYIHAQIVSSTEPFFTEDSKAIKQLLTDFANEGIITDFYANTVTGERKTISEITDFDEISSFDATWAKLTPKMVGWLEQNKSMLEEYAQSENRYLSAYAQHALDIVNTTTKAMSDLELATFDKLTVEGAESLSLAEGLTDEEQATHIAEQLNSFMQKAKDKFFDETGRFMAPEEEAELRDKILDGFGDSLPSQSAIATIVQTWEDNVTPALRDGMAKAMQQSGVSLIPQDISDKMITEIEKNLQAADIDLYKIDWAKASQDEALMRKIFFAKGQLLDDDIAALRQYEIETKDIFESLTQDYDSLYATWEEFDSKVEKGTFTAKTFNSKAFQDFFTDDVKDELISIYGTTSDIGQAIDTVSNNAIVGSEKWIEAWKKLGDALKQAEIETDIKNETKALDELEKSIGVMKGQLHTFGGTSVEKAKNLVTNAIDTSRTVDIDIKAHTDDAIAAIQDTYKDIDALGDKISENLTVSYDDLVALEKQFPKIGEGMKVLSDGTIQLSQKAVDAAKQQSKEELLAEISFQTTKIELQKELLARKKEQYENASRIASDALEGDYSNEEQFNKDLVELQGTYNDILKIDKQQSVAETIIYNQEEREEYEKHYKGLSALDEAWNKKRLEDMRAKSEEEFKTFDDTLKTISDSSYFYDKELDPWEAAGRGLITYSEAAKKAAANETVILDKAELKSEKVKEFWESNRDQNKKAAEDTQAEIDSLTDLQDRLAGLTDYYLQNMNNWGESTSAIKENTDAVKENADAEAELLDLLDEEIDAYHDINIEIEKYTRKLQNLQKQQEKLTGEDLIKNLQEQADNYDILNQKLEEKVQKQRAEAALYGGQLANLGVTFGTGGIISNYSQILRQKEDEVNRAIEEYNAMSSEEQSANKDWVEKKKTEFENFKKLIEKYENLVNPNGEIDKLVDEIEDNLDKQLTLTIDIVNAKYQIKFDEGELKRASIELQKNINNLQDSDVLGNAVIEIQTLFTFDETGEGKQLKENYQYWYDRMQEYWSTGKTPDKRIQDAYKEALTNWSNYVKERTEQVESIVTDSFDRLSKKIERQKTQFETIDKIFVHDMNLIKLKYGDNAYAQLETIYKARERTSKAQLENANLRVEAIQQALQQAKDLNLGADIINNYEDELASALEEQRQTLEDHLDILKEMADNAIDDVFEHLNEQATSVSLEDMKLEWDWVNKDSDDYYDTINGAYELEKLRNKIKKAINDTDDVSTQKALNDLMNDEIDALQQKDKLSKYDLERANALFELEQKRAAFREAQNNKSKMRLRRDASGNYSYQFVSDEDRITSAMQDLADAQNSLYNIDKEAYKNNLDKMYQYYDEYRQKIEEASSTEEIEKINAEYFDKLSNLQTQNFEIAANLQQTAIEKTGQNFEELAQQERDVLMGEIVPMWKTAFAELVRDENFQTLLSIAGAEAKDIKEQYNVDISSAVESATGTTIEQLANGIDPAVTAIESMTESTAELNKELYSLIGILALLPSAVSTGANGLQDLVTDATPANMISTSSSSWIEQYGQELAKAQQNITTVSSNQANNVSYGNLLDSIGFMSETVQFMADRLSRFYSKQLEVLNLESAQAMLNKGFSTVTTSATTNAPVYIDANFPAVNSAQEIKDALNMLVNQATQTAFSTLR